MAMRNFMAQLASSDCESPACRLCMISDPLTAIINRVFTLQERPIFESERDRLPPVTVLRLRGVSRVASHLPLRELRRPLKAQPFFLLLLLEGPVASLETSTSESQEPSKRCLHLGCRRALLPEILRGDGPEQLRLMKGFWLTPVDPSTGACLSCASSSWHEIALVGDPNRPQPLELRPLPLGEPSLGVRRRPWILGVVALGVADLPLPLLLRLHRFAVRLQRSFPQPRTASKWLLRALKTEPLRLDRVSAART